MDHRLSRALALLRENEVGEGVRLKEAPLRMTLLYPSPYPVAMSSLGYLQIHRLANAREGTVCERAMLPPEPMLRRHRETRTPLLSLERQRPVSNSDLLAVSQAYELELAGIVTMLDLCGLEPLAKDRTWRDPLVVLGGPITYSNPLPGAPFADVVVLGEGEGCLDVLLGRLEEDPSAARGSPSARTRLLEELAELPGFLIPSIHGEKLRPIAQADDACLPAVSAIRTPLSQLKNMLLIEPERGCHRGCTFCVMRRSTNGGMRLVPMERVLCSVPEDAKRVGLVGAGVTDHPQIKDILEALIDERKKTIGISSLRADRLDARFVGLLARGGYRSMTVALDAASTRLRDAIEKNLKTGHIENAASLAKDNGMRHLKIYVVVGLPGETEEDLEELFGFTAKLQKTLPVVLGVSPFVPKFHTPLAESPFMGEAAADRTLRLLKRRLGGIAQVRGPGSREAYVEYRLSQGGFAHAHAAIAAAQKGGGLSHWKRVLLDLPERVRPPDFGSLVPPPTLRRRYRPKSAHGRS